MKGFELLRADTGDWREGGEARFAVVVPAHSAYFEGHFPGAPLLPAIAQLALTEQLAARLLERESALVGIPSVRFRLPVGPGERLEVHLSRSAERSPAPGRTRLQASILRAGARVSNAELHFGSPSEAPRGSTDAAPELRARQSPVPPACAYLPQRGPALLVEEVLEQDERASRCRVHVPSTSPFAGTDRFPAYLALEMGAQAAAAAEARARTQAATEPAAEPRAGYLVAARWAHFTAATLPRDASYLVRTNLLRAAPPLRVWQIEVFLSGTSVASAEVSTFAT